MRGLVFFMRCVKAEFRALGSAPEEACSRTLGVPEVARVAAG